MKPKRLISFLLGMFFVFNAGIICASAPSVSSQMSSTLELNPFYEGEIFLEEVPFLALAEDGFEYSSHITYRDTKAEAAADLRGMMTARENTAVVGYRTEEDFDWGDLAREIFAMAVDHTGNAKEGDTLAWAWRDRDISYSVEILDDVRYVTVTYILHYYTTAEMEEELDGAVDALLGELDLWDKSDYEKIRGIYDYICANVKYDYVHVNQGSYTLKYTPYAALIYKTAVCQGFALLYYRLACELNVDTRIIFGKSALVNHTWMIARLGDSYFYLDPTWDRGKTDYMYFLRGEGDFNNHTRVDNPLCGMNYTSSAFYGAYPMAEWDFDLSDIPAEGVTGTCGEGVFWSLSMDGRLMVYGNGSVESYGESEAPWSEYASLIREIVIDRGICGIGDGAFYECTKVKTVTLSHASVSVGENSFSGKTKVMYAEKKELTLADDEFCRKAESADGTQYVVFDKIPSDLIDLCLYFNLDNSDRIRFVSSDGSRQIVRADGVKAGMRLQLLDKNGGVSNELTVALWGDFDMDGKLTDSDAVVLLWSFLKPESYGSVPHCDTNNDGVINASDAAFLKH